MRKVRREHTAPELLVRSWLHSQGFRFRLHRRDLPGSPDIVLPGRGVVIFVNGCFWHGHSCVRAKLPATRTEYWAAKVARNQARDQASVAALRRLRWTVITLWSCEIDRKLSFGTKLKARLRRATMKREAAS